MANLPEAALRLTARDETKAAFESVIGSVEKLGVSAEAVGGKIKGALVGIAAGFGIAALKSTFDGVVASAAALDDLAESTGASVENLSKLQGVAKLANIDIQEVGAALTGMARRLKGITDEGEAGGKGAAKQLQELGISAHDAAGNLKDPAQLMVEIAAKLGEYRDGLGKTQVEQEIFGKGAARIAPFLKDLAEAGELNAKITAEQAAEAETYEKNMKRLEAVGGAWKTQVALGIMPAMLGLSEALLKTRKESDTLGQKTKSLREDGSIEEWARAGAKGVAVLVDMLRVTAGIVDILGKSIPVLVASANLGAAKLQAMFARAKENPWAVGRARAAKEAAEEAAIDPIGGAVDKLLNMRLMSDKLAEEYARQDANRKAAKENKPSLGGVGGNAKKGAGNRDYFSDLMSQVQERIAVLDLEAAATDKVTESQKFLAKVEADLASGKKDLTAAQKAELDTAVEMWAVREKTIEQQKIALKQLEEDRRFSTERVRAMEAEANALEQELARQREANQEIGLNAELLAALKDARMADSIAIKQRQLANAEANEADAKSIELLKEQLDTLNKLRGERAEGVRKQRIADEFKAQEEQARRTADVIERSLTDSLLRGFESGKSAAQNFRDTLYNMFRTLVLKPIIEAQVKPLAEGIGKAVSGSGGLLGLLSDAWRTPTTIPNYSQGIDASGMYAAGGNPAPNTWNIVGEKGPELAWFGPGGGTVLPNQALSGTSINITYAPRIDSRTDQATIQLLLRQSGEQLVARIRDSMARRGAGAVAAAIA